MKDLVRLMNSELGVDKKRIQEGVKKYQEMKEEMAEWARKLEQMKGNMGRRETQISDMRTNLLKDVVNLRDIVGLC